MNFLLSSLFVLVLLLANVVSLDQVQQLVEVDGTDIDFKKICNGPKPWHFSCAFQPIMSRSSYKEQIDDSTTIKPFKKSCSTTLNGESICKLNGRHLKPGEKSSYKVSKQQIKDMVKSFEKKCSITSNGELFCAFIKKSE